MDGWLDGWMDGWMDEWVDGCKDRGVGVGVIDSNRGVNQAFHHDMMYHNRIFAYTSKQTCHTITIYDQGPVIKISISVSIDF